jgi:hypothetical protein
MPAPGQVPGLGSMISWNVDRDVILGGRRRKYSPLQGLGQLPTGFLTYAALAFAFYWFFIK